MNRRSRRSNTMKVLGWLIGIAAIFACILVAVSCLLFIVVVDRVRDSPNRASNGSVTNSAEDEYRASNGFVTNPAEDEDEPEPPDFSPADFPAPQLLGKACSTPNNDAATCVYWYHCGVILASLASNEDFAVDFAQDSMQECGESKLVCCGSFGNYLDDDPNQPDLSKPPRIPKRHFVPNPAPPSTPPKVPTVWKVPRPNTTREEKLKLLPSSKVCGYQHTDDYLYDKNETALDEFPWLAYIPFEESSGRGARCSGFLINKRYVVTTQFCGYGLDPITKVYLGRYNRRENVSCVRDDKLGFDECTETSSGIAVTELIVPEDSSAYTNDIRLLRLEKNINYSDYVRPICLPLNETTRAKLGDEVITSGWGARNYNESAVVKKRLKYILGDFKERDDGTIQMYATPKVGNETAYLGDDGGPLMFKYKHQWFAEGIVHLEGLPYRDPSKHFNTTAAKITALTIEWILDTIEP